GRSGTNAAADVAYIAGAGKQLFVRTAITRDANGNPKSTDFVQRLTYPGGEIRDIVLNPVDWQKGYVVDDVGGVYSFKNSGQAAGDWSRITGNLGRFTNSIRSVEVIKSSNPNVQGGFMVVAGG